MRAFVRFLLPQFMLQLIRGLRDTWYRTRRTYAGVFRRLEDVGRSGAGYEDDEWPATAERYSRWAISQNESSFIPAAVLNEGAFLPLLLSVSRATRVLDFGGATGFSYISAKYGAMRNIDRFVVVEHPNVCAKGRELFKDDAKVEFLEKVPAQKFDVVHIGAALQYIGDYNALLKQLADTKPRWILITKLPAGDNVTFVSAQVNLPGKRFASWLFSVREIVSVMNSLSYELIFRSANEGQVNQGPVAREYRLNGYCDLLFEAAGS